MHSPPAGSIAPYHSKEPDEMTESKGVRAKLARGAIWLAGGRVITNLLGLVSTLVLARLLLPADFGLVALATTLFGVLTAMTNISMGDALIQHRAPERDHYDTAWTLNIARGCVIALIFAAMTTPAAWFFDEPRLVDIMLALSLAAVLKGIENPRTVVLTRDLIFWQQAVLMVGQKAATLVASVVFAILTQSYWAIVFGIVVGQVVGVLISYAIRPYLPRVRMNKFQELFSFSIWLSFCDFLNTLNWNFDNLLIGKLIGTTALGHYTVGNNLATLPTRELTAPLTGTLFPAFSRLTGSSTQLAAAYQRAQALVTAIALPAGVGLALVAEPFVLLTMGERWLPAVLVIQCLAAVFAVQTLGSLAQPLAMALGQTRLLFKRDLQSFAIRVPLIALGAFLGGLPGILYMRIFTGLLGIAFNMNIVFKVAGLGFREQFGANVRTFASCAAMAGAVFMARSTVTPVTEPTALMLELAGLIALGGITYVAAMAGFWLLMRQPGGAEEEFLHGFQRIGKSIRNYVTRAG